METLIEAWTEPGAALPVDVAHQMNDFAEDFQTRNADFRTACLTGDVETLVREADTLRIDAADGDPKVIASLEAKINALFVARNDLTHSLAQRNASRREGRSPFDRGVG